MTDEQKGQRENNQLRYITFISIFGQHKWMRTTYIFSMDVERTLGLMVYYIMRSSLFTLFI